METISTRVGSVPYDRLPDVCPRCHHAVEPVITHQGHLHAATSIEPILELCLLCPRKNCDHLFIATYGRHQAGHFTYRFSAPYAFKASPIDAKISNVSPLFAKICVQAEQAEHARLDQIAGMGYRKALEYLIKDYCMAVHPQEAEQIRSMLLGAVVSKWIDDDRIKQCARRAAWLGNDETHYVRKWEDKDISDLKILIELTSVWIRSSILTKEYLAEMPD